MLRRVRVSAADARQMGALGPLVKDRRKRTIRRMASPSAVGYCGHDGRPVRASHDGRLADLNGSCPRWLLDPVEGATSAC